MFAKNSWIDLGSEVGFTVTLHKSSIANDSFHLFPGKTESQDEYLLTVKSEISNARLPWLKDVCNEMVEFLVVLDKSGSMDGRPWKQVQRAAHKMSQIVSNCKRVGVNFMVYSSNATFTTEAAIQDLRSGGSTNFIASFTKIEEHLKSLKDKLNPQKGVAGKPSVQPLVSKPKKLFILFMTDGEDTVNQNKDISKAREQLQTAMAAYGAEVIVHVLGFSSSHDEQFLESLSLMGTSDGSYNYISEDSKDEALERRLIELVEGATNMVGKSAFVELQFDPSSGHKFLGDWIGDGKTQVAVHGFMQAGESSSTIEASKFVLVSSNVQNPADLKLSIFLRQDLRSTSPLTGGTIRSLKVISPASPDKNDVSVQFRKLRAVLNMITSKMADMTNDCSSDGMKRVTEKVRHELQPILENVLASNKRAKERARLYAGDREIEQLSRAVDSGLKICSDALSPEENDELMSKKMRSAQASYYVSSNQMHNMRQVKKMRDDVSRTRDRDQLIQSDLT